MDDDDDMIIAAYINTNDAVGPMCALQYSNTRHFPCSGSD